jgi:hypothetical protein
MEVGMSASHSLADRIKHAAEELPYEKQKEIYDFAEYLKEKSKIDRRGGHLCWTL